MAPPETIDIEAVGRNVLWTGDQLLDSRQRSRGMNKLGRDPVEVRFQAILVKDGK
jgi:hypothetical protein